MQNNLQKKSLIVDVKSSGGRLPRLLTKMKLIKQGRLKLVLPDGEAVVYGADEAGTMADMQVYDWRVFKDIIAHGDIGLGENYVKGLWDASDLKVLMRVIVENITVFEKHVRGNWVFRTASALRNKFKPNTLQNSRQNVQVHYDLGNDFYRLWLDKGMTYSSALFEGDPSISLKNAQKAKYQRILDRLSPAPDDHILEIGCGWGGFMEDSASKGLRVTGVTLADEQASWAKQRLAKAGLDKLAEVRLQDYREIDEQYDHIVSIGMFEHVGEAYWNQYMSAVYNYLKPGGKAMIQTIIVREDLFEGYRKSSDFIREYIFPGGMLPSRKHFEQEAKKARLVVNDVFHFGRDYAITLENWLEEFDKNLAKIKSLGFDDEFIRKWRFYLASCAAMFRGGRIDVMQVELQKPEE
ncbi:MAG: class I SAM-dependent methyltransferase [Robiginitomaculum sp.]|nr:class I SAM-dependent methyltransferase [Robiginitomaculum sp.]